MRTHGGRYEMTTDTQAVIPEHFVISAKQAVSKPVKRGYSSSVIPAQAGMTEWERE